MNAEVENHQIAELEDMAANMPSSGRFLAIEASAATPNSRKEEPSTQPGDHADPDPKQAFNSEMERLRGRLREPRPKREMTG
jgi:hypothetical protein